MNCLQNTILAPSSSWLLLPLFAFLTSCRILFLEAGSRSSSQEIAPPYCTVHFSNISTLTSCLTWFCARWIRFMTCHTVLRYILILYWFFRWCVNSLSVPASAVTQRLHFIRQANRQVVTKGTVRINTSRIRIVVKIYTSNSDFMRCFGITIVSLSRVDECREILRWPRYMHLMTQLERALLMDLTVLVPVQRLWAIYSCFQNTLSFSCPLSVVH
jgi:hypothetical protein